MDIIQAIIVVLFIILMVTFIILFIVIYQRKQLNHLKEKQLLQSEHTQALLETQLEIQEQTLNTVSQEIHDNIGQVMGLVKINLNNLLAKAPENTKLIETKELVAKAINDLRSLSRGLHSGRISDLGLVEAITQELKTLQNTDHFTTYLQKIGKEYPLHTQNELVLFRIVQESLHNAIRHSEAEKITVTLNYNPTQFCLIITDNGKGFNAAALPAIQKGVGLKSMGDRATLIGAAFAIDSTIGKGTTISVTLPVDNNAPHQ